MVLFCHTLLTGDTRKIFVSNILQTRRAALPPATYYRFTTYQDARRVRLVDGLETNILRVSPVKLLRESNETSVGIAT